MAIELKNFIIKIVERLTEHDDVITKLLRGAPRLGLALGPASVTAGPDSIGSSHTTCCKPDKIYKLGVELVTKSTIVLLQNLELI